MTIANEEEKKDMIKLKKYMVANDRIFCTVPVSMSVDEFIEIFSDKPT